MSLFYTSLAVGKLLDQVKAQIGKAFIHRIEWDEKRRTISVVWEDEELHTGLTVPVEFPAEDLKKRLLPKGVRKGTGVQGPKSKVQSPTVTSGPGEGSWQRPSSRMKVPGDKGPGGRPPNEKPQQPVAG